MPAWERDLRFLRRCVVVAGFSALGIVLFLAIGIIVEWLQFGDPNVVLQSAAAAFALLAWFLLWAAARLSPPYRAESLGTAFRCLRWAIVVGMFLLVACVVSPFVIDF
jgi:hypothetical protein